LVGPPPRLRSTHTPRLRLYVRFWVTFVVWDGLRYPGRLDVYFPVTRSHWLLLVVGWFYGYPLILVHTDIPGPYTLIAGWFPVGLCLQFTFVYGWLRTHVYGFRTPLRAVYGLHTVGSHVTVHTRLVTTVTPHTHTRLYTRWLHTVDHVWWLLLDGLQFTVGYRYYTFVWDITLQDLRFGPVYVTFTFTVWVYFTLPPVVGPRYGSIYGYYKLVICCLRYHTFIYGLLRLRLVWLVIYLGLLGPLRWLVVIYTRLRLRWFTTHFGPPAHTFTHLLFITFTFGYAGYLLPTFVGYWLLRCWLDGSYTRCMLHGYTRFPGLQFYSYTHYPVIGLVVVTLVYRTPHVYVCSVTLVTTLRLRLRFTLYGSPHFYTHPTFIYVWFPYGRTTRTPVPTRFARLLQPSRTRYTRLPFTFALHTRGLHVYTHGLLLHIWFVAFGWDRFTHTRLPTVIWLVTFTLLFVPHVLLPRFVTLRFLHVYGLVTFGCWTVYTRFVWTYIHTTVGTFTVTGRTHTLDYVRTVYVGPHVTHIYTTHTFTVTVTHLFYTRLFYTLCGYTRLRTRFVTFTLRLLLHTTLFRLVITVLRCSSLWLLFYCRLFVIVTFNSPLPQFGWFICWLFCWLQFDYVGCWLVCWLHLVILIVRLDLGLVDSYIYYIVTLLLAPHTTPPHPIYTYLPCAPVHTGTQLVTFTVVAVTVIVPLPLAVYLHYRFTHGPIYIWLRLPTHRTGYPVRHLFTFTVGLQLHLIYYVYIWDFTDSWTPFVVVVTHTVGLRLGTTDSHVIWICIPFAGWTVVGCCCYIWLICWIYSPVYGSGFLHFTLLVTVVVDCWLITFTDTGYDSVQFTVTLDTHGSVGVTCVTHVTHTHVHGPRLRLFYVYTFTGYTFTLVTFWFIYNLHTRLVTSWTLVTLFVAHTLRCYTLPTSRTRLRCYIIYTHSHVYCGFTFPWLITLDLLPFTHCRHCYFLFALDLPWLHTGWVTDTFRLVTHHTFSDGPHTHILR